MGPLSPGRTVASLQALFILKNDTGPLTCRQSRSKSQTTCGAGFQAVQRPDHGRCRRRAPVEAFRTETPDFI